jgi:hypothetical protein
MPPSARGGRAVRRRGPRACGSARALGDRPHSPVRGPRPAGAAVRTPPWSTAPFLPPGVVANGRPSSPVQLGSPSGGKVSAGGEKKPPRLPAHRPPAPRPGCARLGLCGPRGPRGPGPPWGDPCARRRRPPPLALGLAPRGLGAPRSARASPAPPAAPTAKQTRCVPQTPHGGAGARVAASHPRRVAPRHRRGPLGPRARWLSTRAALCGPRVPPLSPATQGPLRHNRPRGREGRRLPWAPSGAHARRDPRPLPGPVALAWLRGPWWPSPPPH